MNDVLGGAVNKSIRIYEDQSAQAIKDRNDALKLCSPRYQELFHKLYTPEMKKYLQSRASPVDWCNNKYEAYVDGTMLGLGYLYNGGKDSGQSVDEMKKSLDKDMIPVMQQILLDYQQKKIDDPSELYSIDDKFSSIVGTCLKNYKAYNINGTVIVPDNPEEFETLWGIPPAANRSTNRVYIPPLNTVYRQINTPVNTVSGIYYGQPFNSMYGFGRPLRPPFW